MREERDRFYLSLARRYVDLSEGLENGVSKTYSQTVMAPAWRLEWKKLPSFLIYNVVLLLAVPDIVNIDSSIASKKDRAIFLDMLSSKGALADDMFDYTYPNLAALRWLLLRNAAVKEIRYKTKSKVPLFSILCMKNEAALAKFVYSKSESTDINRLAVVRYPGWPVKISPLHEASMNGNLSVVEMLVSMDASVDTLTSHSWTPLMFSCYEDYTSCAKVLCAAGCSVDIVNRTSDSALHICANYTRNTSIIEMLVCEYGADVTLVNQDGDTCKFKASSL